MKTDAVAGGVSGGIEQLAGALGIVGIERSPGAVGPAFGRKDAVGGASHSAPQVFEHGAAIESAGEGLAHAGVFEDGIAKVEAHVGEDGSGPGENFEAGLFAERKNHVGGEGIDGDVGTSLSQ